MKRSEIKKILARVEREFFDTVFINPDIIVSQDSAKAILVFFNQTKTLKLTYFDKILLDVLDIDECAIKTDKCDDNAVCNNTQGCYLCTCKDGFYGSGKSCIGNYKRARRVMPS